MIAKTIGLIAAPYTPMRPDGALNLDRIPAYADFLHRNGVVGAFVNGTTGEGLSLTTAERIAMARAWIKAAAGRLKIIIHVGHPAIEDSRLLAAAAQADGADGIAAMAPIFFKPATLEALAVSCQAIAAAAPDLPFYYYHIPSMTGVTLPVAELLRTAAERIPNLAGAKFTFEDLMDFQECLELDHGRFDVLFGRDEMLLAGLAMGARGAVGSTYNFAAPLYHRLLAAFARGDLAEARTLQRQAAAIIQFAMLGQWPALPASKAIMRLLGFHCGPCRLPLPTLTAEQVKSLRQGLDAMGFFTWACR